MQHVDAQRPRRLFEHACVELPSPRIIVECWAGDFLQRCDSLGVVYSERAINKV